MKNLVEKIQELEEKLDKKKEDDEISEFERTKRAVKEEASKTKVDIDILHEKLIVLENLVRKRNHELKDKITLILSRFHIHKNRPTFAAALVLKLVCSKEEEAVLDKEQKLMKSFGFMDNRDNLYNVQSMLPSSHVPPGFMGQFNHPYVPPPRFPEHRRPRPRTQATPKLLLCFRCNKPGHFVRDCPSMPPSSGLN